MSGSGHNRRRKIGWVIAWTIVLILTMTVAYPASQTALYFGWVPAGMVNLMVVALIAYVLYIPFMKDVMFNINPVDEDELRPIENETDGSVEGIDAGEPEVGN